MKLLLVEDEKDLAYALSYQLFKNGYTVDTAPDGIVGIEMASTGLYDVIMLDRMLPCRDGLSILKELRRLGDNNPVLCLTAKDGPKDLVEGLDAGADDYIIKPFSTDELMARLRAWNSCQDYYGVKGYPAGLLDSELILNLFSNKRNQAVLKFKKSNQTVNEDMCLDDDLTFRLTDEEAKKEIEQLLPGIEIAQIKGMPKQQRDRILAGIKDIEGISHRQAARILGISVNLVHKA